MADERWAIQNPQVKFTYGDYLLLPEQDSRELIDGAPDPVVEVLSPGSAERDRRLKLGLYAKFEVKEYWIVDPAEESVQVLGLGGRGYDSVRTYTSGKASSDLIEGFDVELDRVFAE